MVFVGYGYGGVVLTKPVVPLVPVVSFLPFVWFLPIKILLLTILNVNTKFKKAEEKKAGVGGIAAATARMHTLPLAGPLE